MLNFQYHTNLMYDRLLEVGEPRSLAQISDAIQFVCECMHDELGWWPGDHLDDSRTWWAVEGRAIEYMGVDEDVYAKVVP